MWLTISDDEGKTWREPVILFESGLKGTLAIHPRSGLVPAAAVVGGVVKARKRHPGEQFSPVDTFQVLNTGTGTLSDMDLDEVHFAPAPEGFARWLLIGRKGSTVSHYNSTTARTRTPVPEPTP